MRRDRVRQIVEQLALGVNVLVTGPRQIGKSTLFDKVLEAIDSYLYIETKKIGDSVYLHCNGQRAVIGRRTGDVMRVEKNGFDIASVALRDFLASDEVVLAIDEIGFLEAKETEYLDLIVKCAQQKTLFAVVRENDHALKNRLAELQPYKLVRLNKLNNPIKLY
ncbi:MAG: hypothetical protein CSA13_00510 [Clostridiales bacterium]|nr:MAG: hypothetical protein CSA13_00510 [Clostridiales bacterium]